MDYFDEDYFDNCDPRRIPGFPEPRLNNLETLIPLSYLQQGARFFCEVSYESFAAMMETAVIDGHKAVADIAIYPGASSCTCDDFRRDDACGHVAAVIIKYLSGDTLAAELTYLLDDANGDRSDASDGVQLLD